MDDTQQPEQPKFWEDMRVAYGYIASVFTGALVVLFYCLLKPADSYGTGVFVCLPFVCGFTAGLAANWKSEVPRRHNWPLSFLCLLTGFVISLLAMWEGMICLLMALPILVAFHVAGFATARFFVSLGRPDNKQGLSVTVLPFFLSAIWIDARRDPPPEERTETTTLDIDAPPEKVWPYVFSLEKLPEPTNMLLRLGVAHPVATRSEGQFVGASRACVLSTGVMAERISALTPNRLLKFDVLKTPPPMKELNPFGEVHALHEQGYYTVLQGQFELVPLPGGKTRLIGTSRYTYRLYPAPYWGLWTNFIVDQIHLEVMQEIKRRAEGARWL